VLLQRTPGELDSKSASTSNGSEERSAPQRDYEVGNDVLEEFGEQERSELCTNNYVRQCSYFSPFSLMLKAS